MKAQSAPQNPRKGQVGRTSGNAERDFKLSGKITLALPHTAHDRIRKNGVAKPFEAKIGSSYFVKINVTRIPGYGNMNVNKRNKKRMRRHERGGS